MRKVILGAASALALASPGNGRRFAWRNSKLRAEAYEYQTAPPAIVEEAPVVSETVVVRWPVIVEPPPLVLEEYPVYAAPRVYAVNLLCMLRRPGLAQWMGLSTPLPRPLVKSPPP